MNSANGWTGRVRAGELPVQPGRRRVGASVVHPQRIGGGHEVREDPGPARQPTSCSCSASLVPEVSNRFQAALFVHGGDDAVAGSRETGGGVEHPLQHRLELEALVDADTGLAQAGEALFQLPYPAVSLVRSVQLITSPGLPIG